MSSTKPQRRWMASALRAAAGDLPTLPFRRGQRKPMAQRSTVVRLAPRALHSA